MNTTARIGTVFLMTSLLAVSAAFAHHSAAASYKAGESIAIKGKVVEFAWTNPHCHVYIDVTEGPFKGRTYTVELSSPSALMQVGWTRTLLQAGDDVVIHVNPSRVGSPVGLCRNCALAVNGMVTKPRGVQ